MYAAASQDQVEFPSAEMLLLHLGSMSQTPTMTWYFKYILTFLFLYRLPKIAKFLHACISPIELTSFYPNYKTKKLFLDLIFVSF